MLTFGPISSAFDAITFVALLGVFQFGETLFHTGWFLESLATQTLVLFVIRTAGRPWSNPPSRALAVTTVGVVATGMALPYTPVAGALGLVAPPPSYFGFLALVVAAYLGIAEIAKRKLHGVAPNLPLPLAGAPR
jgi:Mg2+-importing ATPase